MSEEVSRQQSSSGPSSPQRRFVTCADLAERTANMMAALMSLVSFAAGGGDKDVVLAKLKEMAERIAELHDDALRVLRYSRRSTSYSRRSGNYTRRGGWKR